MDIVNYIVYTGVTWATRVSIWTQWLWKVVFVPYSVWTVASIQGTPAEASLREDHLHPPEALHDHWYFKVCLEAAYSAR